MEFAENLRSPARLLGCSVRFVHASELLRLLVDLVLTSLNLSGLTQIKTKKKSSDLWPKCVGTCFLSSNQKFHCLSLAQVFRSNLNSMFHVVNASLGFLHTNGNIISSCFCPGALRAQLWLASYEIIFLITNDRQTFAGLQRGCSIKNFVSTHALHIFLVDAV